MPRGIIVLAALVATTALIVPTVSKAAQAGSTAAVVSIIRA